MPTVHLVCGPTAAGKTTYAIALASRVRAVRFSIEEWMANLFAADRPEPCPFAWTLERAHRCEGEMWKVADPIIAHNIHVVFDVGLARRDDRDQFRNRDLQTAAMP